MLIEEIEGFIRNGGPFRAGGPSAEGSEAERESTFDALALRAFSYQYERIEPIRRLCDRRGRTPETVRHWSEIPPVPTSAFKVFELCAAPPREVFRSSGTTQGTVRRSVHPHPFPELYRATIDASFRAACLPDSRPLPTLSLIPSRTQLPDSSLSFMAAYILEHHARDPRTLAIDERGVVPQRAIEWLAGRRVDSEPGLILTTAFALADLLEELAARSLRLPLPPGSVVFETGGFKGRRRELGRGDLLRLLEDRLDVPERAVVREYGMTELTGQAYTRVLDGGDPDRFELPSWMRFHILDPETLAPIDSGPPGLLALFDLSNVGSSLAILTEDLAREVDGGFRLEGRATGAELRGCSLSVEDLSSRTERSEAP